MSMRLARQVILAPASTVLGAWTARRQASTESRSLLATYEKHLKARPVVTKMVTGCCLWGIGDGVGQVVPAVAANQQSTLEYDWERTGRACLFGFALHAPTSHLHFNFLEWMTTRANVTGLGIPIFKAFMEQVCAFNVDWCQVCYIFSSLYNLSTVSSNLPTLADSFLRN